MKYYTEELSPTHYRCLKLRRKLFSGTSEFQKIKIVETHDFGRMLVLDDVIQASEKDAFIYHEILVHPPLLVQSEPKSVLVIGGGNGAILLEILKHRSIEHAVMSEIDQMVVSVSNRYLGSACGLAFDDPRTELHIADGRRFLEEDRRTYDLIILDLTDPIGPSKYLYTREAYELLRQRLRLKGVVATHAGAWFHYPKVTSTVVNTFRAVFPHVEVFPVYIASYGIELAFLYASAGVDLGNVCSETFASNYVRLVEGAELNYVSEDFLRRILCKPVLLKRSLRVSQRVSTDDDPLEFTDYYAWERF